MRRLADRAHIGRPLEQTGEVRIAGPSVLSSRVEMQDAGGLVVGVQAIRRNAGGRPPVGPPHFRLDSQRDPMYEASVRLGVIALAGIAGLLVAAPAWAGIRAQGKTAPMARRSTEVHVAHGLVGRLPSRVLVGSGARQEGASASRDVQRKVTVTQGRPRGRLSVSPGQLPYHGGRVTLTWSSSHATRCTLSASPAFWRGSNPTRVHCRGTFRTTLPAVAIGGKWSFTFKARKGTGKTAVAHRTFTLQAPPFAISGNWAGYAVDSSTPVTEASGQFTVPTLNCSHTTDASEAMWVGIGGKGPSTGDLLQTGVESACSGGTQVENPAWWEEFPEYQSVNFQSMSVSPGDQIEASVYQAGDGSWVTRLDDLTTGVSGLMHTGGVWGTVLDSNATTWLRQEGDASTVSYTGGSSAEWIIEDFVSNGSQVPFADFGTVTFGDLTTSLSSWSLNAGDAIGLGANGLLLAAPSAPSSDAFSVIYTG